MYFLCQTRTNPIIHLFISLYTGTTIKGFRLNGVRHMTFQNKGFQINNVSHMLFQKGLESLIYMMCLFIENLVKEFRLDIRTIIALLGG